MLKLNLPFEVNNLNSLFLMNLILFNKPKNTFTNNVNIKINNIHTD